MTKPQAHNHRRSSFQQRECAFSNSTLRCRRFHQKSGSLSPLKHFAYGLRKIVSRQPLPGYRLAIQQRPDGHEVLTFVATRPTFLPETEIVNLLWG
jgi:Replication initiator protein A